MIVIKLFLILVLSIIFIVFAFSSKLKVVQKLSVVIGYFVLFLFIVYPEYSDEVAKLFSIGSGKDLVLYITVSLTSLMNVILYVGVKNNNRAITKIIREEAKKDAKKCKESK